MIARLLRFALHQRFLSIASGLALLGLGVWAYSQLSIEAYPDISDTQVVVISLYSGRAAEEVEQQVTIPIERALNSVPNVIARRSRTIFGLYAFRRWVLRRRPRAARRKPLGRTGHGPFGDEIRRDVGCGY